MINNREIQTIENSERMTTLKQIFKDLYNGKSVEEVKAFFDEKIGKVTIEEISQLQHEEMEEGDIPVHEMKRLYTAHTEIFKNSIAEPTRYDRPEEEPGHPVHTFVLENREIEKLIENKLKVHALQFEQEDSSDNVYQLIDDLNLLLDIDKHYSRKENLIFPYLERYGIHGPTNHMWRINDYIRDGVKNAKKMLSNYDGEKEEIVNALKFVIEEVLHMVYREENILFPMALQNFTEDEWVKIAHESDEIGYCLISNVAEWRPKRNVIDEKAITDGYIKMETGILSLKQLELLLNHLPVDITFIDQDDVVRYFSHGKERIFARTKAVIGRTVQNCHPPRSVHVVEDLLADFKAGRKDHEDFWIKVKDKFVYIRYFAVRDDNGEYVGTLEFTQNISQIKELEGEKRILS